MPKAASLFTKACRAEQAGELLGQSNSMATAGRIVGAIGGGALMSERFLAAPFLAERLEAIEILLRRLKL